MKVARNIAIVALLALVVAVVPGGDNAARAVVAAISLIFLALISLAARELYRQNKMAYVALTERQRLIFVGALGVLVLMVAGLDELTESGPGTAVWLALIGLSVFGIVRVVAESRTY
jgi:Kef-type K+ transport system membrane component KefB